MKIKSIYDLKNIRGKRVLVRVDFNVPIKKGKVQNDYKIRRALPTIKYLQAKGAKVILLSHLGRPQTYDKKLSLEPVAKHVGSLLEKSVQFVKIKKLKDLDTAAKVTSGLKPGVIAMLDNVRFLKEERLGSDALSQKFAELADVFVSECFAVCHHPAPSVSGVARYLPSYAGILLAEEIAVLSKVMEKPTRPSVVLLGGIKVETKIPVLKNLLSKADTILVGGGIASTYWWARGKPVGRSLVGKEFKKEILRYCGNKKVILPVDVVVGDAQGKQARVIAVDKKFTVPRSLAIYDVGPETVRLFSSFLKSARTLVWNGALGMFEVKPYGYGTRALAHLFAARSKGPAYGVAGGGETVEILEAEGLMDDVDLVSTGGGAMLEFLSGSKLPGIEVLRK